MGLSFYSTVPLSLEELPKIGQTAPSDLRAASKDLVNKLEPEISTGSFVTTKDDIANPINISFENKS